MTESRLQQFYALLDRLLDRLEGGRRLSICTGRLDWPTHGVYLFLEPNEHREGSAELSRVVRVGTHGVSRGSSHTLWNRLLNHRGTVTGGGNHRGSIFRRHVGISLMRRDPDRFSASSWDQRVTPSCGSKERAAELLLERAVSTYIGQMTVLWVAVPGPAPSEDRTFIEKSAIGLLTQATNSKPQSAGWLGNYSDRDQIRNSGLWNVDFIGSPVGDAFLAKFEECIDETLAPARNA